MTTIEIPRDQWTARLDEFTGVHEGWLVSIDVLTAGMGARREVENLPLLGVSADRPGNGGTILMSARAGNGYITHAVHGVWRVCVEQTVEGADAALVVHSADGTRTVLRFRTAALPETVDGLVRP